MTTTASPPVSFRWRVFQVCAIGFFILPASFGFLNKYLDLLIIFNAGEDGAFAIAPIMNYLLSSLGFFMLFFWAVKHGMFHDVEKIKYSMLEQENALDAVEQDEKYADYVERLK